MNEWLNDVFLLLHVMQNVFIDLFYDMILLWNELFSCDRHLKMIVFLDDVFFLIWWTHKIASQQLSDVHNMPKWCATMINSS